MGRKIGKSAIEVMRERFPANASEIETYADAFDVLAEKVNTGGGSGTTGKPVFVPFTVSVGEGDEMTVTTTAVFSEVVSAIMAKKDVVAKVTIPGGAIMLAPVSSFYPETNPTAIVFATVNKAAGSSAKPSLYQINYAADALGVEIIELT